MQIVLPNEIKTFVEREVASGRYDDAEQVVIAALKRMAGEPYPTMTVAEAVAESLAQVERGEGRELTDDVFDELLRESETDAQRGVTVRDEAKY